MRGKFLFGAASAALLALSAPALAQSGDQAGDNTTQARLTTGDAVEGDISQGGDLDWFRMSVERGQRYRITLDGVAEGENAAIDPLLVVYGADGGQLAFNDDTGKSLNSALDYVPAQSGEVFVEARGFSEQATGRYRIAVSASALPADDVGNDFATSTRIAPGASASGNLEYPGDVDAYRLTARTGNVYRISLSGAEGAGEALGDPVVVVKNRQGEELASNDDRGDGSLNSYLEFVPQTSGDVVLEARSLGDAGAGAYTISIETARLPPDNASGDVRTRGRLNVGQNVRGSLDYAGDKDWFRIRLTAGESYRFALASDGESGVSDPYLRLHGADGAEIAQDDDGGEGLNAYLEFTAATTGNYFVEAGGFSPDATGGYTISAAAGDIPGDASTDASLGADGDFREGVLGTAGDSDWYALRLTEGQSVRIGLDSAASPDALQDPMLVLHASEGAEIARDDDGGAGFNSWLEYTAPAAGVYFVEARGFAEDAAGRYGITITPGEIGNNAEMAQHLAADGEGRISTIGVDGDVDWFGVELVEGRAYRFNLESAEPDPLADPMLTLYDGEGNPVAEDDDGGTGVNAYLSFASPRGGFYYVAASSFGGTGTGRYSLRVSDTDVPGNPGTDEYLNSAEGDDRVSRIDMDGDLDQFRVELEGGARYLIDVSGEGDDPLADPYLTIVNSSGELVMTDDDSGNGLDARLRFTPQTSDLYYIQASGLGGSTGMYKVSIVRQ